MESVLAIRKEVPKATFCVHYALKWNYCGGVEAGMEKFKQFLDEMSALDCTILLVSGGGKTRQLDTVAVSFKIELIDSNLASVVTILEG